MSESDFSPEQQQYLKGFFAGVEARRGALAPSVQVAGAPPDLMRQAQDRTLAEGGKLTDAEMAKREKHPLDRWPEIVARAEDAKFPKGVDVLLARWHGLFFVGPTQDSYMIRLRIAGGIVTSHQLRGIADLAKEFGNGFADVTTRANLQLREISAQNGPEVVMRLGDLGLLPRGTGADNIRNITASPTAGIDAGALLDTRPIVRALNHHILNSRDLFGLPRKFNIAVSGGGLVEVLEDTNDIALTAVRTPEGILFRLGLGGITGHRDFARATGIVVLPKDVVSVCDAILRVYIAHGDRTNRAKARLKYLLDAWGLPAFLEKVEAELGRPLTRMDEAAIEGPPPPLRNGHIGIHAQAEPGFFYIGVVTRLGRLAETQLRALAAIAERFGRSEIRLTVWQNLLIPDIAEADLPAVIQALAACGLTHEAGPIRAGLVACTGNAGCKFAASNTKRHAMDIAEYVEARIAVDAPINIHLTGCHHSCAQHYIADIGLLGAKLDRGEEEIESYDLHVGGGAGPQQKIGRLLTRIAHDATGPAVLGLLRFWKEQREADETFQAFSARYSDDALRAVIETEVAG